MKMRRVNRNARRKHAPIATWPSQISYGLARDRSEAFAVRGWRLTLRELG